jgi:hypothetical protein
VEGLNKDAYGDLEKIRIEILKEKIQAGIDEFNRNPAQQWTPLRIERPLLETLLRLVEREN